ncbi:hypothetical protein BDR07DRAFT_368337 [Suillus spraguei]|nr:hypothetical protein BDR07DRAFT_368337 [Suillus spraguei]
MHRQYPNAIASLHWRLDFLPERVMEVREVQGIHILRHARQFTFSNCPLVQRVTCIAWPITTCLFEHRDADIEVRSYCVRYMPRIILRAAILSSLPLLGIAIARHYGAEPVLRVNSYSCP